MANPTIVIVTGANRGIGKAIVATLAKDFSKPLVVFAASRKGQKLDLNPASNILIQYPQVDIADPASIDRLAKLIKASHGTLDVLINNAAAHDDDLGYTPENVKVVLDTNVRGTLRMCQAFIPLLSKNGRIVNVSSTDSSLHVYSNELRARFRNPQMILPDLELMIQGYQKCVNDGTEKQNGWPQRAYSVSKASTNALTAVFARENPGLIINACCPGWVDTDMGNIGGSKPPKAPEDGAKIPIRLGFGNIGGATGKYWGNPSVSGTGEGQVMDW